MSGMFGEPTPLSLYSNLGGTAAAVIKASPGIVFSVHTDNNAAGQTRYMQLFNMSTAPTGGEVPVISMSVNNNSDDFFDWIRGVPFTVGIAWGWSSTAATYTAATANTQTSYVVFR